MMSRRVYKWDKRVKQPFPRQWVLGGFFILVFSLLGSYAMFGAHAATLITSNHTGDNPPKTNTAGSSSKKTTTPKKASAAAAKTTLPTVAKTSGVYTVVGNVIENAAGQPVILHGVDRPSLEWSCSGESVTDAQTGIPASDFTTMANTWNANSVRISVNQDMLLKGASQYCSTYEATIEKVVKEAEAAGLIVIIDVHDSDAGNVALPHQNIGQQCMPDQNTITFWKQFAAIYKGDPNVWFEAYNEPVPPGSTATEWKTWLNGGNVTCPLDDGLGTSANAQTVSFNAAGMQALYNAIRGTGANNIVILDGIQYASTLGGVPLLSGKNVAYGVHPYINTSAPNGATNGAWDSAFGDLSAKQPVITTEFGDSQCGDATYENSILSYMRAHKVGYTAWAWWVGGCSFPSLITNSAGACVNSMGCVIQQDMKRYK
jgi:endoglucanase